MTLIDRVGGNLPRGRVTVELDDIQATVLRYRPEPYYGTHVMLHVDDARAGREFLRSLTPHVDSAADWWQAGEPWIAVAITYSGLVALGVPEDSLQSFPEAFRVGMAARADQLLDHGVNDPKHWEPEFGSGVIHIGVSVFSDSRGDVASHDGHCTAALRGAPWPDGRVRAGLRRPARRPEPARATRTPSVSPRSRAAASSRCPARDGRSKPASSSSATRARPACRFPPPAGRAGTKWHLPRAAQVPVAGRGVQPLPASERSDDDERELLAAKLVGRWRSGAPLTLAPDRDDPALGDDPLRNNDFTYAADPDGRQVPLGSHMRRMNPRDTEMALLADVNLHRIIRRGTTFGAPYDPNALSQQDDEIPRGIHFIFISAKAMATMEFLQQEWINNGNFMSLGDEHDPNVGLQEEGATFTIPKAPVRRRIHGIDTFNVLRGGEYFFMPSLSALQWLRKVR